MSPKVVFLTACAVYPVLAGLGFRYLIRPIYLKHGRLSPAGAILQLVLIAGMPLIGILALRDAGIGFEQFGTPLHVVGLVPCVAGLCVMLVAMATFRSPGVSFGLDARRLRSGGLYRMSRNPQILGFCLFLAGFVLVWPTWHMAPIIVAFAAVMHFMVLTEEAHLRNVFGKSYEEYCETTPRYLWM